MSDEVELREALAPLRTVEPSEQAVSATLAAARARRRRRRRAWGGRVAAGVATATAVIGVALAALPGSSPTPDAQHVVSGAELLRTAAAAAAEQPAPPASAGYRYTETLDHWRWSAEMANGDVVQPTEEIEQRVETWVNRDWRGREVAHEGVVIQGDERTAEEFEATDRPYEYGDVSPPSVGKLPTKPTALRDALLRVYREGDWAPGLPTPAQEHYDLVRDVLDLLASANTTPRLRAGLWRVLALVPGVRKAATANDPLGRKGEGVTIPTRPDGAGGVFTVVFDTSTSELLFWSERGTGQGTPDQSHTILRAAHVNAIDERPPEQP